MIPILYNLNETEFKNRGIGALSDAITCNVTEERNGSYELTMTYPKDGVHFSDIAVNRIIYAIPSPYRLPQPFRIYKISSPMRGTITINAQHISYDLSGITVMPFTGNSMADVLNKITLNSVNQNKFKFSGNATTAYQCVYSTPNSARQILGGMSGSLLDVFGGEYEFDGFNVVWHANRGTNNGVTIRYGKNLLDVVQNIDVSGMISGVIPYWIDSESGEVLTGDLVKMDGDVAIDKIVPLNLTDQFETEPTKTELNNKAKTYISANYSITPELNCTVSFALIEQSEEYKDFRLLEKCDLCDTITVIYPELNVNSTAKIVKITTDVLKEKYISVTIGTIRANIAQTIVAQEKSIENVPSKNSVNGLIQNALNSILGVNGGSVRLLDTNNDGEPDTLYIADNPNPKDAVKVWRFNYEGWAASKNGYNGPFEMGATLNDGLLANFVTAANLVAGTIKSADNGKTFFLDLDNGVLNMNATSISIASKSINEVAKEIADQQVNNFVNTVYSPGISNLQSQIDGQIETFYYDYEPTLNNVPASNWETEAERARHEGDLFYWKSKGYAYRFFKDGNSWKWQMVQDTDITTALSEAAQAQDTADSKRRVFVSQPVPPYDIGDLWVQGEAGDIMRSAVSRQSGDHVSSDWIKASKYTDDTALNSFISGEYSKTIKDLETQADQKSETWYQATDPASSWTSEQKSEHKGDLWYNTAEQKTYIYDGSKWEETKTSPPDIVFDRIDGKAQVFVSQPKPPYAVGDLWVQGDKGDIMRCALDRTSGNYVSTDWVKASKYTDNSALDSFILDEYEKTISGIESQVDGKVETWYQTNDPASTWTTAADKNKHKGDLWFNSTTGIAKRWNGTSWAEMTTNPPKEVFDEIDGKAQIFLSTPMPPYNVGDLWAQGSAGDILTCETARASGNYVESDWKKRNKYIDQSDAKSVAKDAVDGQTQTDVFNKLTNNGSLKGVFMKDGQLYINASYLQTGVIKSEDGKSFIIDLNNGEITAEKLAWESENSKMSKDGTIECNNARINGNIRSIAQNEQSFIDIDGGVLDFSNILENHTIRFAYGSGKRFLIESGDADFEFRGDGGRIDIGKKSIAGMRASANSSFNLSQDVDIKIGNTTLVFSKGLLLRGADAEINKFNDLAVNSIGVTNGTGGSLYWETIQLPDGRTCRALCSWS